MYLILKNHVKIVGEKVRDRFRKGVNTRNALGLSMFLHIFIAIAFASFLGGKYYAEHLTDTSSIEFELVTETDVESSQNSSSQLLGQAPNQLQKNGFNGTEESAGGRERAVSNRDASRQAVVTASLASLSELRESFNFIMHQVAADSVAGFSPVQGEAPNTEFYGAGTNDGNGIGSGSGIRIIIGGGLGGYCPPSHGN